MDILTNWFFVPYPLLPEACLAPRSWGKGGVGGGHPQLMRLRGRKMMDDNISGICIAMYIEYIYIYISIHI